jgi:transcriptional regulator with XRE-family HTH domain
MADHTRETIAENIRRIRGDMNYSEWARRADDHPITISRVERCELSPGIPVLLSIAKGLGCSLADILSGVEDPPKKKRRRKKS